MRLTCLASLFVALFVRPDASFGQLPSCLSCEFSCESPIPLEARWAPNATIEFGLYGAEPTSGAMDAVRATLAVWATDRPVSLSETSSNVWFVTDTDVWEALGLSATNDHAGVLPVMIGAEMISFNLFFNFTPQHGGWSVTQCIGLSLKAAAIHEAGHVFGLEDVSLFCSGCSVMSDAAYGAVCYEVLGELDLCAMDHWYNDDNPVAFVNNLNFANGRLRWDALHGARECTA